jgi:hypothetical protein
LWYISAIVLKRLARLLNLTLAVAVVTGAIVLVTYEGHEASRKYQRDCQNRVPAISPPRNEYSAHSQDECQDPKKYMPWWYVLIAWPDGIAVWAVLATLGAIIWQSNETRRAADATADSANAAYGSVTFAEAQWNLMREKERARLEIKTVDGLNLERVEGGFWHLKATIRIRNLGATRAYIRRGAGELFVCKSREETKPELDTWNSLGLDEDFIDPYSGKIFAVTRSFYFFAPDDATLEEYATGVYEGRFPAHLYGVVEYETLGIRYRRNFGYSWRSNGNPENIGARMFGTTSAANDEERISFGYWREDEDGNEENVAEAN